MELDDIFRLFSAAPTPYLVLDAAFTIVEANEARLRVTNSSRADTIGKHLFDAFPDNPQDPDASGVKNLKASLATVLRTKAPHKMDIQRYDIPVPGAGETRFEERYWRPLNFPLLDADGAVRYIVHQVEDATAEIRSQRQATRFESVAAAVEAERSRLLSIFERLPIGLSIATGPELVMQYANPMYRKTVGQNRKLDGLTAKEAFSDLAADILEPAFRAYRHNRVEIMNDIRATHDWDNNGQPYEKFCFCIWQPMTGPTGEPEGVVTLLYDDSDNIRETLETKQGFEELKREKAMREQFVATLSHDLRNPLAAAMANAHVLARGADDPVHVRKCSERIARNLRRCDQMITNLLDTNRFEAGKELRLQSTLCSLTEVLKETLEDLSFVHGDRFTLATPPHPVDGRWSPDGVKRIVENLCVNAVKYGSSDEQVAVTLRECGHQVEIAVQNWGIVIAAEDQKHLFDLYRRVDEGDAAAGWGLGLALVKGLTEALNGTVAVESSAEEGTVFTVRLPREPSADGGHGHGHGPGPQATPPPDAVRSR